MTIKARFTNEAATSVTVTLGKNDTLGNFSGPIEFSLTMPSPGNKEHDALVDLVANTKLTIAAYVPPGPAFVDEISDRQFFQQLAIDGAITNQEALDAVKTGALPAALQAAINALPANQQFTAEMLLSGATKFLYSNPFTAILGQATGRSPDDMKAIWVKAAAL